MSYSPEFLQSEQPALLLFKEIGYQYLPGTALPSERFDENTIVLENRLKSAIARLNPALNNANQHRAYEKITQITASSLLEANEFVWNLLRGSNLTLKQNSTDKEEFLPVRFIDYDTPANNDFLVVNQCRFHGRLFTAIPDIVVFVNGLPLALIECKAGSASNAWDSAWNDLNTYQQNNEQLFHYNQICAGLYEVGARYGAIGTPQAFYSHFRSDDLTDLQALVGERFPTAQDILLYNLFRPDRLLDLVRHFVLFEREDGRTIKKLPRYQQWRAVSKTVTKLQQRNQGGVIWHTQGSGKSLTMAYLIRKLQAPENGFDNPTILVLTDRIDLDRQITGTLQHVGLPNVQQATSVTHLEELLRNDYGGLITTTLQKFQPPIDPVVESSPSIESDDEDEDEQGVTRKDRRIMDNLLVQITRALNQNGKWEEISRTQTQIEVLSTKSNFYVLVDEAHRSHYSFLAAYIHTVLPNAKFIAFTGTPLTSEDKSTLAEFYGEDYLDVYTITESVKDGATVPLLYDTGIARLDVKKAELDAAFEEHFADESEEKKTKLKNEALHTYQLSDVRIRAICEHLLTHYRDKIFSDGHKAMLVCSGRRAALLYKQIIDELRRSGFHNFETKVVVSLGSVKADSLAREQAERIVWNKEHPDDLKPILMTPPEAINAVTEDFKLPFGNESERAKSGRKQFDNTAILIVSDMLLTGYDAPIASCMYLDKPLQDHNLLQALARVNRTYKGKAAGFIVDYCGIAEALIQAMGIYSGALRPSDILRNLNDEIPKLELNHGKLLSFAKPIKRDRYQARPAFIDEFVRFIEPFHQRDTFKELLKAFNKSINIVLPNQVALKYLYDFRLFNEIRAKARNAFPDDEELGISVDESRMIRRLINDHLTSEGVSGLLAGPVSIIDQEKFKAALQNDSPATKELKIRNQLTYTIRLGMDRNPGFYRPLAERLDELLKAHEAGRLAQAQLILGFESLQNDLINESKAGQAEGFVTRQQIDVFNALKNIVDSEAAALTTQLFTELSGELSLTGWQDKGEVRKDIENKIYRLLKHHISPLDARQKAKELVELMRKS